MSDLGKAHTIILNDRFLALFSISRHSASPPQMPVSEYTLTKNWPYAVELHNAATAWPKPYRKTDVSRQG
jgi:hypothetical protein